MTDSSFVEPVPLLSTKQSKKTNEITCTSTLQHYWWKLFYCLLFRPRQTLCKHLSGEWSLFKGKQLQFNLFYLIKIICNGQGQPNKGNDLWHHKNCTLTEDMHIWLSNYFYRPLVYLSWWSIWQEKRWDLGLNPITILWEREMEIKTELIQVL